MEWMPTEGGNKGVVKINPPIRMFPIDPKRLEHVPGTSCEGAHVAAHDGHRQWHLLHKLGYIWCRDCLEEFTPFD